MSADPSAIPLRWNEALSGITGSVSLAAWIFLLIPQLVENYRQGSADGISLLFLCVWMVGDVTNLAGAAWAGLVPTVVALAVYFCIADTVLISQCVYYDVLNRRREARKRSRAESQGSGGEGEVEPLLRRRTTSESQSNIGLPGSRRRSSASRRMHRHSERRESLASILEEGRGKSAWVKNTISILLICAAGTAGWAIAWRSGVWAPSPVDDPEGGTQMALGAQILGYISAVCYLGARIPQIIKNQRERSCEGLSLLFFLLSLLGNATYGAGILFHSVEKEYFLTNLPWLLGSLGTMVEDGIIFAQFHAFGDPTANEAVE
ncbi:PQ-loop-domain-containing protein [Rhizodiscina lignyota]|uniref:PQ-loop-domain-containing protein n=1 Tax=Rhizodiscina lignyota TaxID=1504668 RepID=A0A9P4ILM1_9PEZI|nr:PQ-loop-domain-containing protein [Rhizodiscina lignyota]